MDFTSNQLLTGLVGGSLIHVVLSNVKVIFNHIFRFFCLFLSRQISVSNDSDFYAVVLKYVNEQLKSTRNQRIYKVRESLEKVPNIGTHLFWYTTGMVLCNITEQQSNTVQKKESLTLFIFGLFPEKQLSLITKDIISTIEKSEQNNKIYTYGGWWESGIKVPERLLSTIFLENDKLEEIVSILESFFSNKAKYHKIGLKHKIGLLFHGKPGTGKTSTIIALANHFNKNVCYLDFGTLEKSSDITKAFHRLPKNSFLVLEDIDCARCVTRDEESDLSISTLLQALDGVFLPEGTVIFATTNRLEKLDEAIIRSGRFDYKFHFDLASPETINRLIPGFESNVQADIQLALLNDESA